MDRVLRHAIGLVLDPLIPCCLAPGRYADVVLAEDVDDFAAGTVIARGDLAVEEGRLLLDLPPWKHEERFRRCVRVPRPLAAPDFAVDAGGRAGTVTANVIGVIENHAATRHPPPDRELGGARRPGYSPTRRRTCCPWHWWSAITGPAGW